MKNLKRSVLREIQEKYVAGEFDRRDEQRVRRVVWVKNTTNAAIPARSAIQLDGWTSRDVFIGVAPSNPIKTAITLDRIPAGKVGRAKIDLFFANLTNATNATYATAALVGQTTSEGAAFAVVARDGNFAALVRLSDSGGGWTPESVAVLKSATLFKGASITPVASVNCSSVAVPTFESKTVVTSASLALSDSASSGGIPAVVAIECNDGVMSITTKYISLALTTENVLVKSGAENIPVTATITRGNTIELATGIQVTRENVVKFP